ncbi:MAG: hypothetical protein VZS44_08665 [Bacilli bacterium]|nr:hypothetical protein [Bacilli bacterium]
MFVEASSNIKQIIVITVRLQGLRCKVKEYCYHVTLSNDHISKWYSEKQSFCYLYNPSLIVFKNIICGNITTYYKVQAIFRGEVFHNSFSIQSEDLFIISYHDSN